MTTADTSSAKAILDAALTQYGLTALSTWAWSKWQNGESIDQIFLELRDTPEYKTRFPAMATLASKGRAISENQYIEYERSATQLMRAAGLPEGFYDQPADFASYLENDVALPELQSRIELAQTAVFNAPPETLAQLEQLYGIYGREDQLLGDLAAYTLDESRALPLIQQQFTSAAISGAGVRSGYGGLTAREAETLARQGLTPDQASQGFMDLAHLQPLFDPLLGTSEEALSRQTGLEGVLGSNARAQEEIKRRAEARVAAFSEGGSYAATQQGSTGLGKAR